MEKKTPLSAQQAALINLGWAVYHHFAQNASGKSGPGLFNSERELLRHLLATQNLTPAQWERLKATVEALRNDSELDAYRKASEPFISRHGAALKATLGQLHGMLALLKKTPIYDPAIGKGIITRHADLADTLVLPGHFRFPTPLLQLERFGRTLPQGPERERHLAQVGSIRKSLAELENHYAALLAEAGPIPGKMARRKRARPPTGRAD